MLTWARPDNRRRRSSPLAWTGRPRRRNPRVRTPPLLFVVRIATTATAIVVGRRRQPDVHHKGQPRKPGEAAISTLTVADQPRTPTSKRRWGQAAKSPKRFTPPIRRSLRRPCDHPLVAAHTGADTQDGLEWMHAPKSDAKLHACFE
ncbi:hypothetical protein JDV02_009444 [Purpureocillium takamizusanense]|uniref:Uncharacterized protein n=1 Tax=Purpureocillium takamizusanense TaxID=2060973 RepID=A0A9Q8QQP0_9HYPO|nr:uncharacterized protein JDV02_009444 [Purpureocillium takamizusanense]UNI23637.1 hypothetical protein JDV02_009444 [Purpureocillium takamizusanense]